MTSTQQQDERSATHEVGPDDQIVEFVHNLGGPVIIKAYAYDEPVGYVADIEITSNEVEVVVVPGTVTRLVAVPRPPDADEG